MRSKAAAEPVGQALEAIEKDVLPSLSALLSSVAEGAHRKPETGFESRSEELREMNRQIIELTRFLAAVTADAAGQPKDPRISA
jgi:hypothetical protein